MRKITTATADHHGGKWFIIWHFAMTSEPHCVYKMYTNWIYWAQKSSNFYTQIPSWDFAPAVARPCMISGLKFFSQNVQSTGDFLLEATRSCCHTIITKKIWRGFLIGIRLPPHYERTIRFQTTLDWSIVKQERWNRILPYLDMIGTNPGTGPAFVHLWSHRLVS
jgi:hypothetical protein